MKRIFMLALLISVFSVSMSAQVSKLSWSLRYDSIMNPDARIELTNNSPKVITTCTLNIQRYYNNRPEDTLCNTVVYDLHISPYSGGVFYVELIPRQYNKPEYNWMIYLVSVRYADGTVKEINKLIAQKCACE